MEKQTNIENGMVSPENETERVALHLANKYNVLPPYGSDIETLELSAQRFRQSGKTTLAKRLESMAQRLAQGTPQPQHIIVSNDAEGNVQVITQDLSSVEPYISAHGELEKFRFGLKANKNILLTGHAGCGKTSLVEYGCKLEGYNLISVQGGAGANFERIIGHEGIRQENGASVTFWQDAILPMAMNMEKCALYFDEPNTVPAEVTVYLHPAMDYRRTITLPDGRIVKAKAGFVVLGAMNEGYSGTSVLNAAFRSRFGAGIHCQYLSQRREATLLMKRCGATKELADKLTKLAKNLRDQAKTNKQLRTPIGTRNLMDAADLVRVGCPEIDAVQMAIVEQIPATYTVEKKAVSDAVTAYFGINAAPVENENEE